MDTLLLGILFVIAVLVAPSLIDKVREVMSREEEKEVKEEKVEEKKEEVEKEVKEEKTGEEKEKTTEVQEQEKKEATSVEGLDIEKTNVVESGGGEIVKSLTQDNLTIDTSDIDAEFSLEVKEEKEKEVKLEKTEEVEEGKEGILESDKDNLLESLEKVIETEEEEEIDLLRDLKGQKFDVEELQAELEDVLEKLKKIKVKE